MKLYGIKISNYYNLCKIALLEKGLEFEEVNMSPGVENREFLTMSPLGKIPALVTEQGTLCESQAILLYLERLCPDPALIPTDPYMAGHCQQIHQFIDLYLDGPARKVLGAAYFGKVKDQALVDKVSTQLDYNVKALASFVRFDPFIGGDQFTNADGAACTTMGLASNIMKKLDKPDPLRHLPGIKDYFAKMAKRGSVARVQEDQKAAMAKIFGG